MTKLLHLGLGYNCLEGESLTPVLALAPTLMSLDISFNRFTSLGDLCDVLAQLPRLKHVWVAGNPLCLCKHYRCVMLLCGVVLWCVM